MKLASQLDLAHYNKSTDAGKGKQEKKITSLPIMKSIRNEDMNEVKLWEKFFFSIDQFLRP